MRRTGRFALLFLLVFVLSTFAIAFHHHADGADHRNCPACAAAHFPAAVSGVFALESPQPLAAPKAPFVPARYGFIRVAALLSRAPPA
jgi:hypothetical protein